jgi:hypothetical protein
MTLEEEIFDVDGTLADTEDSRNGVHAALGAGIPVLVTESSWTRRDDFTGAVAVLPDLGRVDLVKLAHWHDPVTIPHSSRSA